MANRKRKAASAGFSETRSLNTRAKKVPNKTNNATFYHDLMEYVRTQMTPDQLQPFETLPSRSDYPDYYTFISQPISFAEIGAKYSKSNASSPLSILKDFDLLCVNAQTYNARFSLIYVISGLLQSAVHQYYLLTQVPSEYKQYASTVLETEARLLSELENHKPRVKNASYVCESFIDPPGKSHNPEILQKVKELKLASNTITSTTKARELLWTGHYMDPAKFKSELDSFFVFLQEVYDPKSSNEGSTKRYQNAAALQRSFTSRYEKYIKGINLPQPEGYLEWSSEFSFEPIKDEAEELNQDASQDPLPETSSLAEGLSTLTGRTTTRSAWKQQQNKDVHDEEPPAEPKQEPPKSTGLTIKFKSGTSSSASSGASQKSRRKSSEKSEKRARMDRADTLEEEEEEVVAEKPKPMPAPKIKLSFRGTRSRSRGNTQVDAEQESHQDDSVEDVLPATSSKKMANPTDKLDNQKSKIKILGSDSAKNLKTLEKEVKSQSKRRRKEEPEEEVVMVEEPTEKDIIVEPTEEVEPTKETDTNGEVLESTSHQEPNEKLQEANTNFERSHSSAQPIKPVYANPSRRSSDFDKKGLIRDATFASVIPTITKYYQSKNLVPPGSQSSNLQVKFPSSDGFINRSFSLWVPYYQHTFTFSVLLHEWLNTSNFYHAEVTHNKTPLSTYKRSDTSPWATETEPITNRYEVVLVSGLNLIELVVVAQPKPLLQSEDAVSKPRKGQKEYPADAAAKRQHEMKNGALGEMSLRSTRASADSQMLKGKGQADGDFLATRSVRSRTQNMFDPHGEPLQVEKLSLWVTMGAAPYA